MSLVAYASSDEGESSGSEDEQEHEPQKVPGPQPASAKAGHTDVGASNNLGSSPVNAPTDNHGGELSYNAVYTNTTSEQSELSAKQISDARLPSHIKNETDVHSSGIDDLISDDEEDFPQRNSSDIDIKSSSELRTTTGELKLPPPRQQSETTSHKEELTSTNSHVQPPTGRSLFSVLPKPRAEPEEYHIQGKVQQAEGGDEEDELEDIVKPRKFTDDPEQQENPPPAKKPKQTVKITIPSLPDAHSDEEDESSKKKPAATGKSGLFSLLPEPVHAARKEANRILVPHSLTKKPKPPAPTTSKPKPKPKPEPAPSKSVAPSVSQRLKLAGVPEDSDSEDDEEDGGGQVTSTNFFSIGQSSSDSVPANLSSSSYSVLSSISCLPSVSTRGVETDGRQLTGVTEAQKLTGATESQELTEGASASDTDPVASAPLGPDISDAPLQFKSMPSVHPAVSRRPVYPGHRASRLSSEEAVYYTNEQYNWANMETSEELEGESKEDTEKSQEVEAMEEESAAGASYMTDEQFFRIQGKKARGHEAINIIDVSADDQTKDVDLLKMLSEESEVTRTSSSKKKNKDMPTSQQKRKHQITYLAHQAKEREIALKNQWAENRATKKQTQSKYGF